MSIILETIIVNTIFLLFPLAIYLVYIAYIRNMDLEEKTIFFDLAIFSSIYFIIRYGVDFDYIIPLVLLNIPLLICYLKKNNLSAVILSFICVIYCHNMLGISHIILLLEYFVYFIVYNFIIHRHLTPPYIISYFVLIKAFVISLEVNIFIKPTVNPVHNAIYVFAILLIFTMISYLILYFLQKGEEIMDLNATINELEKEKRVRASLFKITHEIKNPIAVCKGYLDMMDYNDGETVRRYTKIVKDEIGRTLILMDDFLSCTKVKIEKEEVDLYLLLEEIGDALQPLFRKNKIATCIEVPDEKLYVMLDYNRMKQVIVNVLKNAIEAKKNEGKNKIWIEIEEEKEKVVIFIRDNGIGMDSNTLKKVDEMFYTTKEKGTGLGVSLSKEIVELHGGAMKYYSTLGKGTTVAISLPLA